jgi:CMP-N,N'-diacetyllegionaminic acid synthase
MINNKKVLALIPARGGSKRLPGKNIMNMNGRPMICWTIDSAIQSKYIDRVIVSTDDDDIASVSKKCGASVPFMRPNYLSTDESKSIDVALFVLDRLSEIGECYEYLFFLQPTSPLRTYEDINNVVDIYKKNTYKAITSVTKGISKESLLVDKYLDIKKSAGDNSSSYFLNGAIYFSEVNILKKERTFFPKDTVSIYLMDKEKSIDVDTNLDFKEATLEFKDREQ